MFDTSLFVYDMDIPFPETTPRFVDSKWFSADNPCDEEAELTALEQLNQSWLSSVGQQYKARAPLGKTEPEPMEECESEEEDDSVQIVEDSDTVEEETPTVNNELNLLQVMQESDHEIETMNGRTRVELVEILGDSDEPDSTTVNSPAPLPPSPSPPPPPPPAAEVIAQIDLSEDVDSDDGCESAQIGPSHQVDHTQHVDRSHQTDDGHPFDHGDQFDHYHPVYPCTCNVEATGEYYQQHPVHFGPPPEVHYAQYPYTCYNIGNPYDYHPSYGPVNYPPPPAGVRYYSQYPCRCSLMPPMVPSNEQTIPIPVNYPPPPAEVQCYYMQCPYKIDFAPISEYTNPQPNDNPANTGNDESDESEESHDEDEEEELQQAYPPARANNEQPRTLDLTDSSEPNMSDQSTLWP